MRVVASSHPLCRAKAGIGGMAWWEGGGGSWGGKEVRWWATDRLVRGPTVNLADIRSLRPCTCSILADRGVGWGCSGGQVWCEKPSNCQLEYTQHGGLTCKSTRQTRRLARLQPARSARRPARQCVVCTRVACHHPSMVCHLVVTGTALSAFRPAARTIESVHSSD